MSIDLTPWLIAGALALSGAGMLAYSVRGLRRGRISPMIRSYRPEPYDRTDEPWRFWASLVYNGAMGAMLLVGGIAMSTAEVANARERPLREACLSKQPGRTPQDIIATCDHWLSEARPSSFDVGLARAMQADGHAMRGDKPQAALLRRTAISAYGGSLSGYPEDSAAHWNSAWLMLQLGDLPQAREAFQDYTELEPDGGDGWLELGLVELALKQLPSATVNLTRAIERLPGEARPLAARAIAYRFAGDDARAVADFEAARQIDPAEPLVQNAGELFVPIARPSSG